MYFTTKTVDRCLRDDKGFLRVVEALSNADEENFPVLLSDTRATLTAKLTRLVSCGSKRFNPKVKPQNAPKRL